jgi:hypothetical protein
MKTLTTLVLATVSVFAPLKAILITVMVLSLFDLLFACIAAKRQGKPITSGGFKRTVLKVSIYEVAVFCAFLVSRYLTGPEIPVERLLTSLIGLTELKSILEHLDEIANGNFFKTLTDRLQRIANAGDRDAGQ